MTDAKAMTEVAPQEPAHGAGFESILFATGDVALATAPPDFFTDLNLDQIVEAATAAKPDYELKPFFQTKLGDIADIVYRQDVFRDLDDRRLHDAMAAFANAMRETRGILADGAKLHDPRQQDRFTLDAASLYCEAVLAFGEALGTARLRSQALQDFHAWLSGYAASEGFQSLRQETRAVMSALSALRYSVRVNGGSVTVRAYDGEADYTREVEDCFARFRQGASEDYRCKLEDWPGMDHVEAKILEGVAQLFPEPFAELGRFADSHASFADPLLLRFEREAQFYLCYLGFIAPLQRAGLKFCLPELSRTDKAVYDYEGFDLALARKLTASGAPIVCNDFQLDGKERILVVTGPNQGGKTTFARSFGQLHYLAALGLPVPGREAQLFVFDRLLTHFGREEDLATLSGNLQDDLIRMRDILDAATPNSMVIVNELFASTTLHDALLLSRRILSEIAKRGLLCVWVTFIDEMSRFGPETVSMVSTVLADDPTRRSFKILRRPADGRSYAIAIAEKYGLTYDTLTRRLSA